MIDPRALLAFVKAVQNDAEHQGQHSLSREIPAGRLTLVFGRGYFQGDMVLAYLAGEVLGEVETEEAADAYVTGRVPKVAAGR